MVGTCVQEPFLRDWAPRALGFSQFQVLILELDYENPIRISYAIFIVEIKEQDY